MLAGAATCAFRVFQHAYDRLRAAFGVPSPPRVQSDLGGPDPVVGELAGKLPEDRAHRGSPSTEERIGRAPGVLDVDHDHTLSAFAHGWQGRGETVNESPDVHVEGTLPGVDIQGL
jgi:hypothetical protein